MDNGYIFYGLGSVMVGYMSYKFISSFYNSYYIDKGVQTDVWEDYSDRASQILQTSPITDNTITPGISPTDYVNSGAQVILDTIEIGTQTIIDNGTNVSTVTTVLPIPPVNIEMIPNPDIINKINNIADNTDVWFTYMDKASALADMWGLAFM